MVVEAVVGTSEMREDLAAEGAEVDIDSSAGSTQAGSAEDRLA